MSRFLIPDAALSQHVIALGKTRSGKSSKLRLIVERLLDQKTPVCIIDPKGDWWGLKSSADGKRPGYPIIIFGSEFARHADIRINGHSGAGVAELVATGNRPCLIDLKGMRTGERTRFFIDFAATYFAKAAGARVLVIDEVHHFAPQGKIPDPQIGEMLHWANRLVTEGGGMGITMMSASQRPQKVHKDYTSSHETMIANRVITKHDRDAIKDWIDACGDPVLGREVIGSLAGMQRTEAWVYSPEAGFGPVRLTFPMFSTYDSFKPQSAKGTGKLKGWASIDLKEVEARLTKVVEEAKANDPKALRKQIADLEAKLRKATAAPAGKPAIDKEALQAAEALAFEKGVKSARRAAERHAQEQIRDALQAIDLLISQTSAAVKERIKATAAQKVQLAAIESTRAPAVPAAKPAAAKAAPAVRAPTPRPDGDGSLTSTQLETLQAMAWWKAVGHDRPTRKQLAGMLGIVAGGSTMRSRLAGLLAQGLIAYPSADTVALTVEGEAAAPPPDTAATLVETIRASLTATERQTFDAIPEVGSEISREELGIALNPNEPIAANGSTMRSRLASLGKREIITYPSPGTVARQDWVVG